MTKEDTIMRTSEVETQVFDAFSKKLEDSSVAPTVTKRLRVLLFSANTITEKAVTDALFRQDDLP